MRFDYKFMMRHHTDKLSIRALARELNCHPNTLRREMIKAGIPIKSKSDSLKDSYSTGHLTARAGFQISDEHKLKISKANKGKVVGVRNKTNNLILNRSEAMRGRGASKNREAAKIGSKFERMLVDKLTSMGYNIIPQYKFGDNYRVDLFFNKEKIAVEIDGISHREPIYGEDKLANSIAKDKAKDELMISMGMSIVRVKDNQKSDRKSVV